MRAVGTAIISDLHLGVGTSADLLRQERFRELLGAELAGADRVILLGDVLELRDRPLGTALAVAKPVLGWLAEVTGDAELVLVPGNHDHHLIAHWLERRTMAGAPPLGLEQAVTPLEGTLEVLARSAEPTRLTVAYPGVWIRPDVYALHGHYLDRHLTIPTMERLGVALVERLLGIPPGGPDPLEAPATGGDADVAEYEHVQAPVYEFLFALAQATVGERRGGADPSIRVWQLLSGKETRAGRIRGWLLGSVALPGAVGVANRLGLGPVRADLSPGAITSAGLAAMREVTERLGIDARHVIFGHTHRRGPLPGEAEWAARGTRLWNTGSWVFSPTLVDETAAKSPYWPGTVAWIDDAGPPELVHLLDGWTRDELTRAAAGDAGGG
jgi:hypothetical protein